MTKKKIILLYSIHISGEKLGFIRVFGRHDSEKHEDEKKLALPSRV